MKSERAIAGSQQPDASWTWPVRSRAALTLAGCVLGAVIAAPAPAWAAVGIYSCVDASGKRLTSDRPIAECLDREQRVLNKDGSQRHTLPPRMTPEERAVFEEQQRQKVQAEAARKDAVRRDRNLMLRFPDQVTHDKAREAALDDLRKAIAVSERRVADLKADRQPMIAETEFYKGRPLPLKLRGKLEANEASQQAQLDIIQNQKAEMVRINGLYDAELARLRRLWAGAAPGSVPAADRPSPAVAGKQAVNPASSSAAR